MRRAVAHTEVVASRKRRLANQIGEFMREYGRKKRPGGLDPNDRQYDRQLQATVKRMDPAELDEMLHGDVDEDSP
jgi:hypothetical protein